VRAYLDSQVSGALSFRHPSEADLRAPIGHFLLASLDCGRFVPIDFRSKGLAKCLEYALGPVQVGGEPLR
jgi:hypothetical protein